MFIMMKLFFISLKKYGRTLKKQDTWIRKYTAHSGLSYNKNPMFGTNLKLWLSEAEDTFGKRICPCFSPTGDEERDKKLLCPCKYLWEDIEKKGTCHCTLFAAGEADKKVYKSAMNRLMAEYQTPMLKNERGEIDVRKYPLDEIRGLRVPDAYHLVKRAVHMGDLPIKMFVEYPYEIDALQKWGSKNGYGIAADKREDGYSLQVKSI